MYLDRRLMVENNTIRKPKRAKSIHEALYNRILASVPVEVLKGCICPTFCVQKLSLIESNV